MMKSNLNKYMKSILKKYIISTFSLSIDVKEDSKSLCKVGEVNEIYLVDKECIQIIEVLPS